MNIIWTTLGETFQTVYGFSTSKAGLTFLPSGIVSMVAVMITSQVIDKISSALTKKHNGERNPRFRLPLVLVCCQFVSIGLLWYGWAIQTRQPWLLSLASMIFMGLGVSPALVST
jgi:hypothetical protein